MEHGCRFIRNFIRVNIITHRTTPFMNHEEEDPNVILGRLNHGQLNLSTGVWTKVTNEAKQLIASLINLDPNLRPSAAQVSK